MTTQEQAFAAYYASMSDADLLRTAGNKKSFVEIAQRLLAEELVRRHLEVPPETKEPSRARGVGPLARLIHRLHRAH